MNNEQEHLNTNNRPIVQKYSNFRQLFKNYKMSDESEEVVEPLTQYEKSVLKRKDYTIIEPPIGKGAYSRVFKAKRNGHNLAAKVIDCEHVSEDFRYKFLPRELYVLRKLKHPFIIRVDDIFTIANRVFVFMEMAAGDSLEMLKTEPYSEPKIQLLVKQVCTALEYMHGLGIAHRDIKCENILLNSDKSVAKLSDFGFARKVYDLSTGRKILTETHCGSIAYVAPEVLEPGPIDAIRADCWSVGVLVFVWINKYFPFTDKHNIKRLHKKQIKKRYKFVDGLSDDCKQLISKLMEPDYKLRYTMPMVVHHKWLSNVNLQLQ